MFGKKEASIKIEPDLDLKIATIPNDFYAGADPTVKFKETEKTVDLNKLSGNVELRAREKIALDTSTAKGGILTSRKFMVIGGFVLFVIFLGGAGLYYWWKTKTPVVPVIPQAVVTVPETPVVTPVEPAATTTLPATTTEPVVPVKPATFELPSRILALSSDMDSDQISDAAEEIFGSDPGNPDTDNDGYPDGHELFYLYNPKGIEPEKLIDSGAVKKFDSGLFGYSLYYPQNWAVGAVDQEGRQMLFSTLTGENIEIRVFDLDMGRSFADWFALNLPPEEQLTDYGGFQSRFGVQAKMRSDNLVYFFYTDNRVFAVIYHTNGAEAIDYKAVMEVIARSFALPTGSGEPAMMIPETAVPPAFIPIQENDGQPTSTVAATGTVPIIDETATPDTTTTLEENVDNPI